MRAIRCLRWVTVVGVLGLAICASAAEKSVLKLTVGYTPISGAALPFFLAGVENLFKYHGLEC